MPYPVTLAAPMPQDTSSTPPDPGEVTLILRRLESGNPDAASQLLPLVYQELRRLAGRAFSGRQAGATLQPTAIVHDAFLRLVGRDSEWNDRQHFYAVAARAMRSILADRARARAAEKRGGGMERVSLSGLQDSQVYGEFDLEQLDAALTELARLNERQARVVELRFLTGLPIHEVGKILDISMTTVTEDWRAARAFLRREMRSEDQ